MNGSKSPFPETDTTTTAPEPVEGVAVPSDIPPKPRDWQHPDYPEKRINEMTDAEVSHTLRVLKVGGKRQATSTPEQLRDLLHIAVRFNSTYERYVRAHGPPRPAPVPATTTSTTTTPPLEVVREIRLLRSKGISDGDIAGQVKTKFLGPYSAEQIGLAYRTLDEESRQADQDASANTEDALSRAREVAEELADEMRQDREEAERIRTTYAGLIRTGERGRVLLEHGAIADYLHAMFHTVSFNKQVWIYDDEQGLYRENKGDIEGALRHIIDEVDFRGSITKEARDIVYILLTINRKGKYPFNQHKDAIPVQNCILKIDFQTGQIDPLKHSPEWLFTVKFPVVYRQDADWRPFHDMVISRYLEDTTRETDQDPGKRVIDPEDLLYQIPAQALLQLLGTKPYKKSYIIQGDANGGKTTYLEWLTRLFGPDNVSHSSLHQVVTDRFVGGILENKVLNSYDDLSDLPLSTIGPFKTLTGGFDHQIERKHAQPYQGRIYAVHVFTCNSPPGVDEKVKYDSAFWTRWEYLHFGNIFEVDPGFIDRAYTEENISGSFNKVLAVMVEIRRAGLLVDSSPSEVKDSWELSSDPFARFVRDHMVESIEEHTFPKELFLKIFGNYCKDQNINERKTPTTTNSFTTLVFKQGFKVAMRGRSWVYISHKAWKPDSKYRPSEHEQTQAVKRGDNKSLPGIDNS